MTKSQKSSENQQAEFSFESLEPELNQAGYNTYIMPVNADNAVEQILVSTQLNTGEAPQDAPVIQIMFVNDLLAASNMGDAMPDYYILQFFVSLPLQGDKTQSMDMHQLLSVFSRLIPVGAFGLSDQEGAFFRYSLISTSRNLESKLVVELVRMISFFINKFSSHVNALASGQKSLQDVLQDTEKELSQAG